MKSKKNIPYFILNPNSGGGRGRRDWKKVEHLLPGYFSDYEVGQTSCAGEGILLAKKAVNQGYTQIVSVGGDGTLNEVVNGLMQAPEALRKKVSLSLFPLGSGDDFAKSILWPKDFEERLRLIAQNKYEAKDVGLVHFQDKKGKKLSRHFINIADFGMGGEVVARVNKASKLLGGKLTYLISTLETILSFKPFALDVKIEGRKKSFSQVVLAIVANGSYFGGGLCVAPEASLEDGLFEILIVEKMPALDFIKLLPQLYLRRSFSAPGIHRFKASLFSASSPQGPKILLDCDGEQPGTLAASFELIPQALQVTIP